tara:strand:- start:393 stop:1061 length:669 start_codon:yes stop_codon:yes gene_type:complete
MKIKLAKLEQEFASNIWKRGRAYYYEGLLGNIIKTGDSIKAESYGSSTYRLKIDLKEETMSCSCPCDFYCKHLAALIMWLKRNKPIEISKKLEFLKSKTKPELINILGEVIEKNPELLAYVQTITDESIKESIKKIWLPEYDYTIDFFNQLDFIKDNILKKDKFDLAIVFLKKLIDMFDHDPDSHELMNYIEEFLMSFPKKKLTKKQVKKIRSLIQEYPFDY